MITPDLINNINTISLYTIFSNNSIKFCRNNYYIFVLLRLLHDLCDETDCFLCTNIYVTIHKFSIKDKSTVD